jgi:hypothetical protein
MTASTPEDLGFTFRQRKSGDVQILRLGALAATLRNDSAAAFLAEVAALERDEVQQLMARLTGNYRRGNERVAANHPRNARLPVQE